MTIRTNNATHSQMVRNLCIELIVIVIKRYIFLMLNCCVVWLKLL